MIFQFYALIYQYYALIYQCFVVCLELVMDVGFVLHSSAMQMCLSSVLVIVAAFS